MSSTQVSSETPLQNLNFERDQIRPAHASGNEISHTREQSFTSRHSSDKAGTNPFATPAASTVNLGDFGRVSPSRGQFFQSRRIKKDSIEKPWLTSGKDTKAKWQTLIPLIGFLVGLAVAGYIVYDGYKSVPEHQYCLVLEDDFSHGLNTDVWTKEAEVGGFGNGQFDETTVTDENVYIKDGMLNIKPTLQDEKLINENNVINLFDQGICASDVWKNCVASTNITNGTIVPPAKSGRINSKKRGQIKYGRVEVVAKMPKGDWLWPAIWMLPVENKYGQWPLSGEIDIAESRGNNHTYPLGGNNIISSALHWGPDLTNDAWWRTYGKTNALMSTFADEFHVFGLEWSEKYLYMYLDSRLLQVMYTNFKTGLWQRGNFALSDANGTAFVDPWSQTGRASTPFDQNFYLILNVAVGGTNGWFVDGKAEKPWVDASPTAKKDFWNARDRWFPTWTKPEMQVKSVKMWQQKGYNGC